MSVETNVIPNNVTPVPSREQIDAIVRARVAEGARMCGNVTMKSVAKKVEDRVPTDIARTVIDLPNGQQYVIEAPWDTAWADTPDRAGMPA